jgi:hypothetical protein
MARSLNKKYFGNRNVGANGTLTTGEVLTAGAEIGGEGVDSVDNPVAGSINIVNAYPTFPALTASAPTIANGVTATFAVTWEVDTVTIAGGTGYTAGTITSITGLDGYANVPTRFTITAPGGVPAFNAFTNRGEYTNINGTGIATWAVVRAPGDGAAQATIKFRVKSIAVVNKGSGYVSVPSLSWGTLSGTSPSGNTPTLTTDSGAVGSVTNRENAIVAYAYSGSLVEVDIQRQVSSKRYRVNKSGDTSREGARIARIRYDAEADGTKGYTAAEGIELNIVAIDSDGGTYLVRKLTNHNAVVVPMAISRLGSSAGVQFPATTDDYGIVRHMSVPWTFNGTTAPKVLDERPLLQSGVNVKLENA